jgi:hypothetical protein
MRKRVVCIPVLPAPDFVGEETLAPNGFKCSNFAELVMLTEYGLGDYLVGKWQGVPRIIRSTRIGMWIAYCSMDTAGLPQNPIAKRILRRLGFDVNVLYGPVVLTKETKAGLTDKDLEYLDGIDKPTVTPPPPIGETTDDPPKSSIRSVRFDKKRRRVVITHPSKIEGYNDHKF